MSNETVVGQAFEEHICGKLSICLPNSKCLRLLQKRPVMRAQIIQHRAPHISKGHPRYSFSLSLLNRTCSDRRPRHFRSRHSNPLSLKETIISLSLIQISNHGDIPPNPPHASRSILPCSTDLPRPAHDHVPRSYYGRHLVPTRGNQPRLRTRTRPEVSPRCRRLISSRAGRSESGN